MAVPSGPPGTPPQQIPLEGALPPHKDWSHAHTQETGSKLGIN